MSRSRDNALDGPAINGFTTDISLVDPSVPRRSITPRTNRTRSRTVTSVPPERRLSSDAGEQQDGVNDEDSQDDLMDLATSKVSGFRMR